MHAVKYFIKKKIELTAKEFEILYLLVSNPSRVYTYDQIFEDVWCDYYFNEKKRISNHIWGIRGEL